MVDSKSRRNDHLHGYAPNDINRVFETIAQQAENLRDFLSYVRVDAEIGECTMVRAAASLYTAEQLVMLIGAQADQMIGYQRIGTVASWTTGDGIEPKAVQA